MRGIDGKTQRFVSMKFHSVVVPDFRISLNKPSTREHDEIFGVEQQALEYVSDLCGEDSIEL